MSQLKEDEKKYGFDAVTAAASCIRDRLALSEKTQIASVGVVLGSGLGAVADNVEHRGGQAMAYGVIPHFPTSSVAGHRGRLVFGEVNDTPVLIMQGRVHPYEGYHPGEVAFPVRVLFQLGVKYLILTNAAGGLGEGMTPGALMLISDHINLTGNNPLVGENDERFGTRFPDMSNTYARRLRELAKEVAQEKSMKLFEGVYAAMLGPSYETPAEIRMLNVLGASAVGMSTVYEAVAAAHAEVEVLGISCITNLAAGLSENALTHDEVKETALKVEQVFGDLVLSLIPRLKG